jgi:tetratricopeptide (TPR) repeat protein
VAANVNHLKRTLLCLYLVCAFVPGAWADQNDFRLNGLFEELVQADDQVTSAPVEREIWRIWSESGDGDSNAIYRSGLRAMGEGDLEGAIAQFDQLVLARPRFAEGWNKRATVLFYAERHDDSMRDIQRTLALEPRHFGAISGMGLIFLSRRDYAGALMAFEQVLRIHPSSEYARKQVEQLKELLSRNKA